MRFEVPQFIDIEDKIFGPLTWRQFLYVGGGVGMGVVLFITTNFLVFLIVGLPLSLLAGALAFYPVNNRPFSFFLEAIVNYLKGTKLYLWKKKDSGVHQYSSAPVEVESLRRDEPTPGRISTPNTPNISLARRLELEAIQKKE